MRLEISRENHISYRLQQGLMVEEQTLLTVADVAVRLKVTQETVREWLRTDQLHGFNLRGQAGWRIPASEVQRMLVDHFGKRSGS